MSTHWANRGYAVDTTALRAIYERTGTDAEASALYGCHKDTWGIWRRTLGWPAKRQGGNLWRPATKFLTVEESERRMAVYNMGRRITTKEAALRLGITANCYKAWLRQHDLVNKHDARGGKLRLAEERRRMAAYREAATDAAAARRLGLPQPDFHKWRVSRGLPPKHRQGHYRGGTL